MNACFRLDYSQPGTRLPVIANAWSISDSLHLVVNESSYVGMSASRSVSEHDSKCHAGGRSSRQTNEGKAGD
jgi:hypothetical protein